MKLKDVIRAKRRPVVTVHEDASVSTVASILDHHDIGAVVVVDDEDHVIGMMTEREVVRAISREGAHALSRPITSYMNRHMCTCEADDQLRNAASKILRHRTRHIPVIENQRLVGIISSGDVLKWRLAEVEEETHVLREIALASH